MGKNLRVGKPQMGWIALYLSHLGGLASPMVCSIDLRLSGRTWIKNLKFEAMSSSWEYWAAHPEGSKGVGKHGKDSGGDGASVLKK